MSGYIGNIPTPQATQSRQSFTATSGQTSFATVGYTPGFVDVYVNGVHMLDGSDYNATNGSDVVLTTGATAGDIVEVISYATFEVNSQTFTGNTVMADGLTVDNDGATVLTVDRATSDGTIIDVQKDGTSVGGVGASFGTLHLNANADFAVKIASVNSGAYQYVAPISQATFGVYDGQVDLGLPISRYKDLYLSGGVYLGGTGAANRLTDYEQGTWTLVPPSGVTISTATSYASYTRVGRLVTVSGLITPTSLSGTVNLSFSGLPFTSSTGAIATAGVLHQYIAAQQIQAYIAGGEDFIRFYACDGGAWDRLSSAQISLSTDIYFSITYQAQ